jgi:hypothetical protein
MSPRPHILRPPRWLVARGATLLSPFVALALFPGCATMMDGPTRTINVKSPNAKAVVFIDGKPLGAAPIQAHLSRWGTHKLRIEAPGFEPWETRFKRSFNSDSNGNLIVLFPPGYVIDLLTGAIFEIEPEKTGPEVTVRGGNTFMGSGEITITTDLSKARPGASTGHMQRKSSLR